MLIVDCVLDRGGWSPIHHLVALAARLFEAEVVVAPQGQPAALAKLGSVLRGRSRKQGDAALLICPGPPDLIRLQNLDDWRRRFKFLAAWVIDSYWLDEIPKWTRLGRPFDQFFITSSEDVDAWRRLTGVPTAWLPWGTDVLAQGGAAPMREWDLTRVGRQPPEWVDDAANASAAQAWGLRYRGRVPGDDLTPLQNQAMMMREVYARTKYVIAFSNRVNPEKYTHPVRQYLTARWVDALACGAVVAGVRPQSPDVEQLLWPGATLELGGVRRDEGLAVIAREARAWTPAIAARNHAQALERLDWRWRLAEVATSLRLDNAPLRAELAELARAVAVGAAPAAVGAAPAGLESAAKAG